MSISRGATKCHLPSGRSFGRVCYISRAGAKYVIGLRYRGTRFVAEIRFRDSLGRSKRRVCRPQSSHAKSPRHGGQDRPDGLHRVDRGRAIRGEGGGCPRHPSAKQPRRRSVRARSLRRNSQEPALRTVIRPNSKRLAEKAAHRSEFLDLRHGRHAVSRRHFPTAALGANQTIRYPQRRTAEL